MAVAILSALLLAATPLAAAESAAIDAAVQRIYAPYSDPQDRKGSLDAPVYSAETAALLAQWKRVVPEGEVDRLNDGDWFCQCQDYDARAFRVTILRRELLRPGVAQARIRIALGWGAVRTARLVFRQEAEGWRLDDMFTEEMPEGFKREIRLTIAEDEALARESGK